MSVVVESSEKIMGMGLFSWLLLFSFLLLIYFPASAQSSEFLSFKYSKAPLSEVIKDVAEITGKGIVFSGMDTRITWIQKFPKIGLFEAFKVVLHSQGFYLVREKTALWSIRQRDDGVDIHMNAWAVKSLENVIAEDLQDAFGVLFGGRVRITGGGKGGKVAVIGGQVDLLPVAVSMVEKFDALSKPGVEYTVYTVRHVLLRDVVQQIIAFLGKDVGLAPNPWSKEILVKGSVRDRIAAGAVIEMMDKPRKEVRRVLRLHRLHASEVSKVIASLGDAVEVQPVGTSEILFSGPAREVTRMLDVARDLDGGREQVRVEAVIAVITDEALDTLGMRLATANREGLRKLMVQGLTVSSPNLLLELVKGSFQVDVTAGSEKSNGQVLSSPSLTVLDGRSAKILVGQNIPLISRREKATKEDEQDGVEVQRVDVGLALDVVPNIEGDFVRLNIVQEVSSVAPEDQGAVDVTTNVRRIETSVLVPSGETIYLGGVKEEETGETVWRMPIFGYLPLIGELFTSRSESTKTSNLVISLKPVILSPGEG